MLPIVFFLLKIPWPQVDEPPEPGVLSLKQTEAEKIAADQDARDFWKKQMETQDARLLGLMEADRSAQVATLWRLQINCCYADAVPVEAKLDVEMPSEPNAGRPKKGWVKIIGKLDFRQSPRGEYRTLMKAKSVTPISGPANPLDP